MANKYTVNFEIVVADLDIFNKDWFESFFVSEFGNNLCNGVVYLGNIVSSSEPDESQDKDIIKVNFEFEYDCEETDTDIISRSIRKAVNIAVKLVMTNNLNSQVFTIRNLQVE